MPGSARLHSAVQHRFGDLGVLGLWPLCSKRQQLLFLNHCTVWWCSISAFVHRASLAMWSCAEGVVASFTPMHLVRRPSTAPCHACSRRPRCLCSHSKPRIATPRRPAPLTSGATGLDTASSPGFGKTGCRPCHWLFLLHLRRLPEQGFFQKEKANKKDFHYFLQKAIKNVFLKCCLIFSQDRPGKQLSMQMNSLLFLLCKQSPGPCSVALKKGWLKGAGICRRSVCSVSSCFVLMHIQASP